MNKKFKTSNLMDMSELYLMLTTTEKQKKKTSMILQDDSPMGKAGQRLLFRKFLFISDFF